MSRGLAYDSDEGRDYAAAITAIMHGEAYRQSRVIARDHGGPFAGYAKNREPFLRVIAQAPRRGLPDPRRQGGPGRPARGGARRLGRGARARQESRLPQRPGDRARAHRHHRLHDGLRHDRHRAGHRAHQVQEAGRRRLPQDRQPDGPGRAAQARLRAPSRSRRSSTTSTSARPSRARRTSSPSTCRSSTAPSSRPTASAPSTTWATSG